MVAIGLKRRSNPIVVEPRELIALPQSEPATCPGNTSTPSGSSSSRRSEWKSPSAPSAALDGEVGSGCVADEERVAREDEPRLVGPRRVDRPRSSSARAGGRACGSPGSVTFPTASSSPSSSGSCGYSTPAAGWMLTGTPCSSARRPCPETWSACVCVSSVRTMRTPSRSASASDRLDRERRVDDDRLARLLAADEVRRAAEVRRSAPARRARRRTLATDSAIEVEVSAPARAAARRGSRPGRRARPRRRRTRGPGAAPARPRLRQERPSGARSQRTTAPSS